MFYATLCSISPYTRRVTNDVMFYRESESSKKEKNKVTKLNQALHKGYRIVIAR